MSIDRGAVRLIVRRLEDIWNADTPADCAYGVSHLERVRFAFYDARAGDQEQLPAANLDASDFEGLDHDRHK
jgi:hypothetical protein